MKVFKIYHTRFFFLLSLLFLLIAFSLLGLGIYAVVKIQTRWVIYILIIWGLYSCYSIYFLLSLTYFRFKKYEKCTGKSLEAKVTHSIPQESGTSAKALAEVDTPSGKKYFALVGLYGNAFEKKHPDGSPIQVFVMDDNEVEALLLESTDEKKD